MVPVQLYETGRILRRRIRVVEFGMLFSRMKIKARRIHHRTMIPLDSQKRPKVRG